MVINTVSFRMRPLSKSRNQGRRQQLARFRRTKRRRRRQEKGAHQRIGKHRRLAESLLQPPQIRRNGLGAKCPHLQPGLFQQAVPFRRGQVRCQATRAGKYAPG